MNSCRVLLLFVIAVLPVASFSVPEEMVYWDVVDRIRDEGFNRSKVADYAWYLSDFIGPRLTASPNMKKAQEWVKGKMDELGLANAALEPWGETFAGWEVEYASVHMVEPDYQMVIGYPLALTPGTGGRSVRDAVIVDIQKKGDLDRYRGKLRDKIILATPKREFAPRSVLGLA